MYLYAKLVTYRQFGCQKNVWEPIGFDLCDLILFYFCVYTIVSKQIINFESTMSAFNKKRILDGAFPRHCEICKSPFTGLLHTVLLRSARILFKKC